MRRHTLRLAVFAAILSFMCPISFGQETAGSTASATPQKKGLKKSPAKSQRKRRGESPEAAKKRADALRAIMAKLKVGKDAAVVDIGAGNGRDSWVFADVVGSEGKVYSEEITDKLVKSLDQESKRRKLSQVLPIKGTAEDPCLPEAAADMAYMHSVYHHFSKPRPMLRGLWQSLKPGGYLVIVDRRRGTLQDWVPREERANKHHWIAETTVVREAREGGFQFATCAEDCWPSDDQFVLVFQKPLDAAKPGTDPDPLLPLDLEKARRTILPGGRSFRRPVLVALGESRKLIGPILGRSSESGIDVVLEEWATQKDERPALPEGISLPSVLTEKGNVELGNDSIDTVFFLDTYHLLFHHETLLKKLHAGLTAGGRILILDRRADQELSRREASHRRKISIDTVTKEMTSAGFRLQAKLPAPAADRFLLMFEKVAASKAETN